MPKDAIRKNVVFYTLQVIVVVEQLRRELHLALDCVLAKYVGFGCKVELFLFLFQAGQV